MGKVKAFFKKIGDWFKRHKPTKRRLIQLYAALLTNANLKGFVSGKIYQGPTKNACVPGLNCYSCPGAIGACPLGALQDSLAQSSTRAPVYILGILAILGIMLGRTICGFLCPFGLVQDLMYKIKSPKAKKGRVTRVLSYFKYVILAVMVVAIPLLYNGVPAFCKYICPAGTLGGAVSLLANKKNAEYFGMLGFLFSWKFAVLVLVLTVSIFVYRFFCRFFCPLGAIYGFFNKIALLGVKLDKDKCVDCGACLKKCKMDIKHVGDHECINCGECIPVCPTNAISWKGSKIFLHPSTIVHTDDKGMEEPKPLNSFIKKAPPETEEGQTVETGAQEQTGAPAPTILIVTQGAPSEEGKADTPPPEVPPEAPPEPPPKGKDGGSAQARIKKRNKILQIIAWALALIVLCGALLYYNVFVDNTVTTEYKVGDKCPTFTLEAYQTASDKEHYSTLENIGKVSVLNFWYTTCDPCKKELPDFEKVCRDYGDEIAMFAVHIDNGITRSEVQEFLDAELDVAGNPYKDYRITFVQDVKEVSAGGMFSVQACPMTVVIDPEGYVFDIHMGSMKEEALCAVIEAAKQNKH